MEPVHHSGSMIKGEGLRSTPSKSPSKKKNLLGSGGSGGRRPLHDHNSVRRTPLKSALKSDGKVVDSEVSLNGRPYQQFIHPNVDLTKVKYRYMVHNQWILPLADGLEIGDD